MKKTMQHPLVLGSLFFIMQLLIILSMCTESSMMQAWLSLASHWDSEWYAAIAQYGYINIDGPEHSGLLNANVVFFPGYPYLARILILCCHIDAKLALLLVAQFSAFFFWCFLFYILQHLSWQKQVYAAMWIVAFPTSWFLFMGYSESLFIVCCCVMLRLMTEKRWVYSGLWGIFLTATRLIGLPVLAAPLGAWMIMNSVRLRQQLRSKQVGSVVKDMLCPGLMIPIGSLGCLCFLAYCAVHLGSWHLYFDMERMGWNATADPFFLFKAPTWLPPPWGYPVDLAPALPNIWGRVLVFDFYRWAAYTLSECLVPLMLWLELFFGVWLWKQRRCISESCLVWYVAGLLLFLLTCFSLSTRYYESMSRCLLPVWVVLIISDALNEHCSFFCRSSQPIIQRVIMMGLMVIGFGFWIQLLNRFLLGWWVA